jgi:hypothetical protein
VSNISLIGNVGFFLDINFFPTAILFVHFSQK